ncbi:MAG: 4Fe-4S binding protein [Rhodobacteraceae bacterium]|nr:4Fe-4S binding protein [Paracoccaceae bacterium]
MKRKVIEIDQNKCIGCAKCASVCPMGVIKMIDGKAHPVNELMCDGAGKCIGKCPVDAIKFIEKEIKEPVPCACPGSKPMEFKREKSIVGRHSGNIQSELRQWPVQLSLVNPMAPFFQDADLLIAADCSAFSFGSFHQRFLKDKVLLIFCPKLDQTLDMYVSKMASIFKENSIKSITMVKMEVPCCTGLVNLIEKALKLSGKNVILKEYTLSLQGEII